MNSTQAVHAALTAENVGGIDETEVSLEQGITVLAGRNATNRTSLLRAVMGALGSDMVSLKADADEGYVELDMGGETYTRRLRRQNGTVVTDGSPYLSDPAEVEVADLFAFLLESNEARRAVARGDELRELLMRPVDTDAIERESNRLVARRDTIDDDLAELDRLAEKLPGLESRRQEVREEIEAVEERLEEKRTTLTEADESVEERRQEQSELDEQMSELEDARGEFTRTRQRLSTERSSVESLQDELAELRAELEEIPGSPDSAAEGDVEAELERLRDTQDRLDDELTELQSIVQFNEKMLDGTSRDVVAALRDEGSSPTDELLPDEERTVVCWTCGSAVERTQLEDTIDDLRSLRSEKLDERSTVRDRIEELQETRREHRELVEERRRLEGRIERAEEELADRRDRIEELESERDALEERVEELEGAVRERQVEDQDRLLELNRAVNELEFERDQLETDLENVGEQIERIEARLDEREDLEAEREEVSEGLAELRTRIERTEEEAVEQFNDHMDRLLDTLGYENLDRIWIERKSRSGESAFDLHVIRTGESGAAYEDRIDHLSESEREVTGLVFALAGYLVHDVHETLPFLLLDSLEALDSERIARLVEYFGEYAENLVVALLPEDAAAVEDGYQRVRDI